MGRSVGSLCRVLREQRVRVAERTYQAWKRAQLGVRDAEDAVVIDATLSVRANEAGELSPESMQGRRKMTAPPRRRGLSLSLRRMDRLMSLLDAGHGSAVFISAERSLRFNALAPGGVAAGIACSSKPAESGASGSRCSTRRCRPQ